MLISRLEQEVSELRDWSVDYPDEDGILICHNCRTIVCYVMFPEPSRHAFPERFLDFSEPPDRGEEYAVVIR